MLPGAAWLTRIPRTSVCALRAHGSTGGRYFTTAAAHYTLPYFAKYSIPDLLDSAQANSNPEMILFLLEKRSWRGQGRNHLPSLQLASKPNEEPLGRAGTSVNPLCAMGKLLNRNVGENRLT